MSSSISLLSTTNQYNVRLNGHAVETTVTDKAAAVDSWVQSVRSHQMTSSRTVVSMDCKFAVVRGKVSTLALCVDRKCIIIQLFYMDCIPQSLRSFLADAGITFVGIGIGEHVDRLANDYSLVCHNWMDLEDKYKGRYTIATVTSVSRNWLGCWRRRVRKRKMWAREDSTDAVLGMHSLGKPVLTKTIWEERNLYNAQVKSACIDAYASYLLGCKVVREERVESC